MPAKRYCKGRCRENITNTEFEFINGIYLEENNGIATVDLGYGRIIKPKVEDIEFTDLDLRYDWGVIKRCEGI